MTNNKHTSIAKTLQERINGGVYTEMLPKALDLAAEFAVNFKTVNKAIKQLVDKGVVYRKSGTGTFVSHQEQKIEDMLIELLFVGQSEVSSHPFYNDVWQGIIDGLDGSGYKIILTKLKDDPLKGGLRECCSQFIPTAAKMLVGTNNSGQIELLKEQGVPFVLVGSRANDPSIPSVYTSTSRAINSAVDYLREYGIKDIAYIGVTYDEGEHFNDLDKFHAYMSAVQKSGKLDGELFRHTPPVAGCAAQSMKEILAVKTPQAVFVAYDHLVAEVYEVILQAGLRIPEDISVIGIDNLGIDVNPRLTSIDTHRYKIGFEAAKLLLAGLKNPEDKMLSVSVAAKFDPHSGDSIL